MLSLRRMPGCAGCALLAALLAPAGAASRKPVLRTTLPPITVTAQKAPEDPQQVPVSVTAVHGRDARRGRRCAASATRPPTRRTPIFNEFTARKLSNARFRGVGSSPNNPGVTTYIDGVPQLNANSSSIELLDIDQIEFVRGPQSALFGRNALGGVINITSGRPSLAELDAASVVAPFGNFGVGGRARRGVGAARRRQARASASASATRGATASPTNDVTGNDIDSRSAGVRQGAAAVDARPTAGKRAAMFTGERARDGDYGLQRPRGAARQPVPRLARLRRASPIATSSRRPSS